MVWSSVIPDWLYSEYNLSACKPFVENPALGSEGTNLLEVPHEKEGTLESLLSELFVILVDIHEWLMGSPGQNNLI